MFSAHKDPISLKEQSLFEHLMDVSIMAGEYSEGLNLKSTGELIGILHDLGKATKRFNAYLDYCILNPNDKFFKGTIDHSTAGAKLIYERYYKDPHSTPYERLAAQIISLVICSHHTGLIDNLDLKGINKFFQRMNPRNNIFYGEAVFNFKRECMKLSDIDILFKKSSIEVENLLQRIIKIENKESFVKFSLGVAVRFLLSSLIDADRQDSTLNLIPQPYKKDVETDNLWESIHEIISAKMNEIEGHRILSNFSYAVEQAKTHNKERIFYIFPFSSSIEEIFKEISELIEGNDIILADSSDNIYSDDDDKYKLLEKRWDSPIVITSINQLLNVLFGGSTKFIRKLHNLQNSVIIFDNSQILPIKYTNMFYSTVNFLSEICGASIIFCTELNHFFKKNIILPKINNNSNSISNTIDNSKIHINISLTNCIIKGGYDIPSLKKFILDKSKDIQSTLTILNTKNQVKELFEHMKNESAILIYNLSEYMCPSHIRDIVDEVKGKLGKVKLLCISTEFIEFGFDLSFDCVVREVTGFNRITNSLSLCSDIKGNLRAYIVNTENNVDCAEDMKIGKECTRRVLEEFKREPNHFDGDIISLKLMDRYFEYYYHEMKDDMNCRLKGLKSFTTMYDILSVNSEGKEAFKERNGYDSDLMLKQAFKTAGENFKVMDEGTFAVIVPYKDGRNIISSLENEDSLFKMKVLLSKAQKYSINLPKKDIEKLMQNGAITSIQNGLALSLKEEYYDKYSGIIL